MDFLLLFIAIAALIFTYFQVIVPFAKGEVRLQKKFPFVIRSESQGSKVTSPEIQLSPTGNNLSIPQRLLAFIWNYPTAGGNYVSWAVKESAVLKGDLNFAINKPGLGIAIFSTELALRTFGDNANSRVDGCINWGLSRTQKASPFLMLAEGIEPITSKPEKKTDFRHTLAFSIILARTRKQLNHLQHYVRLTIELQEDGGGWPPGEGVTVSEVFTVFYAAEFLTLCSHINDLSREIRKKAIIARDDAIDWLIRNTNKNSLWKSDVLNYPWDQYFTTAWVLRRLIPLSDISSKSWILCANQAFHSMILGALDPSTWSTTNDLQRFRVEARIASASTIFMNTFKLDNIVSERVTAYLKDWRQRTERTLLDIPEKELDLSTALFLVDSLINPLELKEWGNKVMKMDTANMTV